MNQKASKRSFDGDGRSRVDRMGSGFNEWRLLPKGEGERRNPKGGLKSVQVFRPNKVSSQEREGDRANNREFSSEF